MKKDKKKEKIAFKDRAVVRLLKEKAPDLLGSALEIVGDVTGIDVLENIGKKIEQSNDIPTELKEECLELIKIDVENFKIAVDDRKSARLREVELAKSGKRDLMMIITGCIGLGAFVFLIVSIVFKPELQDNKLLIHLLGMVEGAAMSIFFYYFGSSKGSKDKTKLLGKD